MEDRGARRTPGSPVYLIPVLDTDHNLVKTERRVYDDVVEIAIGADGTATK